MNIDVRTNADEVVGGLTRLFADQIPFATARAINKTAIHFQDRQRAHQRDEFEVRRAQWVDRAVKLKPFAKKTSLEARVAIDPPGDRADILTKFEEDRVKIPIGSRLAIPVDVPRTASGIVRKAFRPKNLDLQGTGRVKKGKRRTFGITNQSGGGGAIFQRYGRKGRTKVRVLFVLVPDADIEPGLQFEQTATDAVAAVFPENFAAEFDRAIRNAR